ncbi:MAG: FAD-dependent oxidoreductase, partial [Alphaproteobacteria bacterium]|nr:FAD-dependent oxidoreductase [Alphaproteobacteria bacterium]
MVVIGGGNAGLCAAITAAERGCSVLVVETAPREFRGGNTRHTRNLRSVHDEPTDVMTDRYTFEEYWDDLMRVTKGVTNEPLAKLTLESSQALMEWLIERGVRFQKALSGTLNLNHTNAFFLGGGRAMLNSLCRFAESVGVNFVYEAEVTDILLENGFCESVDVTWEGQSYRVRCKQLITASGGFEADLDWLAEGWGDAAKNFLVRGTPYNKGKVLRVLLDRGAQPVGSLDQCHAVA